MLHVYSVWGIPAYEAVILSLVLFVSIWALLSWIEQAYRKQVRQPLALVGGLVGLSYAACDVYWFRCGYLIQSRAVAVAVYVTLHLLGGIFVATLISLVFPRSMKALLPVSIAIFVALNIFAYWFETRYMARLLLSSDGTGFFVGALLAWSIFRIGTSNETLPKASNHQPTVS